MVGTRLLAKFCRRTTWRFMGEIGTRQNKQTLKYFANVHSLQCVIIIIAITVSACMSTDADSHLY